MDETKGQSDAARNSQSREYLDNTVKTKRLVGANYGDRRKTGTHSPFLSGFWVMLATHDSLSTHWHRAQAVSFDSFRWNQANYGEHCKGGALLSSRLLSHFLCCLTHEAHVVKLEWYHSTPFAEGMLVTVTGAKETPAARFRAILHPSILARFASDTFSSFATRVTQLRELSMKADMLRRMMQDREPRLFSTQ